MPEFLDMSQVCFDKEGKPTAYFEAQWASMVKALGGENAPDVSEQIELAQDTLPLARVRAL